MRNLLWKDFWQNSRVLLGVVIVAMAPYGVALVIAVPQYLFGDPMGPVMVMYGPGGLACHDDDQGRQIRNGRGDRQHEQQPAVLPEVLPK